MLMLGDGRLRLLVLDDAPGIIDPETKCPSFVVGCSLGDREILERNYSLSWLYRREDMKAYYYRLLLSLDHAPEELLSRTTYPNLVLFDYSLDRAATTALALSRSAPARKAFEAMNPLGGNWGKHSAILGLSEDEFAQRMQWTKTRTADHDDLNFDGCFVGGLIGQLLRSYATVAVPQTVHRDHKATDFFEWMLDVELRDAFNYKTGLLERWFVFLKKALPRLRSQIIQSAYRGTLLPTVSDILTARAEGAAPKDLTLGFVSQLGTERFRVEALFLDELYTLSMVSGGMEGVSEIQAQSAIADWCDELLNACLRRTVSVSELSEGWRWSQAFIAAFASPAYEERNLLSRSLKLAGNDAARLQEAINSHETLIRTMALDTDAIVSSVREGRLHKLEIPDDATIEVLEPLPSLAGEATRAAVLAIVVWSEMAATGLSAEGTRARIDRLANLLRPGSEGREAFLDELEELEGMFFPPGLASQLRSLGRSADEVAARELYSEIGRRLGVLEQVAGVGRIYVEPDEDRLDEGKGWQKIAGSRKELIRLVLDVLAPAPRKVLLGHDRPEKRGDAVAPLKRLPEGEISIADIVEDRPRPEGAGLYPGEGRLLALFAAQFGFDQRHWRPWFRKAVST